MTYQQSSKTKLIINILITSCMFLTTRCVVAQGDNVCEQITACKCQFPNDGPIIDISSLGYSNGSPRFLDVPSQDGYLYSYNPCGPFEEGVCKGAAVCKKDRNTGETLNGGMAEGVQFTYDSSSGETIVGYTAGTMGEIHSFVYLMCDESKPPGPPQFYPNGTLDTPGIFILTMYTVCACGDTCDANGIIKSSASLGVGTIICFGLVGVFLLYFVIGSVFMKFGRNASGKEIIPNSSFWFALPGTIKAGFRFVFISRCSKDARYDNI